MKKRSAAFLLAAAVFLSQLPQVSVINTGLTAAALTGAEKASLEVQSAGTELSGLKPGDKVYADVSVSPMMCSTFALDAVWDRDSLELTNAVPAADAGGETGSVLTYVPFVKSGSSAAAVQTLKDYQNKLTDEVCVFAFSSASDVEFSGTAVTLEFTVKSTAENGWSDIEVYFDGDEPPKYFGETYKGIEVTVSTAEDEDHDGKIAAEITGGTYIDSGLRAITFGNSKGVLEPEFSNDVWEYTYTIPETENGIPEVYATAARDAEVTITQAADLVSDNTALIKINFKKDIVYKVRFVKEVSNRSTAPVIYPERDELYMRNEIINIMCGNPECKIYYTTDGTDPTTDSDVYTGYFTADTLELPADAETLTVKAMTVQEGKEPSGIVERQYKLPEPGALLSGITVNGEAIDGFDYDLIDYVYTMDYAEWMSAGGSVTVTGTPLRADSSVTTEPAVLEPACADGAGAAQDAVIKVRSAGGDTREYTVHVIVNDCPHPSYAKDNGEGLCGQINEVTTYCELCGKVFSVEDEAVEHTAGAPVVQAADCIHDGYEVISCSVCGTELQREIIPATGEHNWIASEEGTVTSYTCSVCGAVKKTENYSSDGHEHSFTGDVSIIKAATCTDNGIKRTACAVAGCTAYTEEILPLAGHSYEYDYYESCTEDGYRESVCSVCGAVEYRYVFEPLGHSFSFGSAVPSCKEDIVVEAECENGCGTVQKMVIPRSGRHSFDNSKLHYDSTGHWYECAVCGAKEEYVPHVKDSQWVSTADPDVWENYCAECDYVMATQTIVPPEEVDPDAPVEQHEHEFGEEWVSDGSSHWHICACGERSSAEAHVSGAEWNNDASKHWKLCTVCGAQTDTAFHTEDEGKIVGGDIVYSCTVCGYEIRREPAVKPHVHSYSYSDNIQYDKDGHWYICTGENCDDPSARVDYSAHRESTMGYVTKDATPVSKGEMVYPCAICGYEMRKVSIPVTESLSSSFETESGASSMSVTYIDGNTGETKEMNNVSVSDIHMTVDMTTIGTKAENEFSEEKQADIAAVYDISMYVNETEVEPTGNVVVTIPVPDGEDAGGLRVYHQEYDNDGNVKYTDMHAVTDGKGNLVFTTDSFSIYILAKDPQQYGQLIISNEIIRGDKDKELTVAVKLTNNGLPVNDAYISGSEPEPFESGSQIILKNEVLVEIGNIPDGTEYIVEITDPVENCKAVCEGMTGTVKAEKSSEAVITCVSTENTESYELINNGTSDEETYDVSLTDADGDPVICVISVNGTVKLFSGGRITLAKGEKAVIECVPAGTLYTAVLAGSSGSGSQQSPGGTTPSTPPSTTPSGSGNTPYPSGGSWSNTGSAGKDDTGSADADGENISSGAGIAGEDGSANDGYVYAAVLAVITAAGIFVCRRRNKQK